MTSIWEAVVEALFHLLLGTIRPIRYVLSKSFRAKFHESIEYTNRIFILLYLVREWVIVVGIVLFFWLLVVLFSLK